MQTSDHDDMMPRRRVLTGPRAMRLSAGGVITGDLASGEAGAIEDALQAAWQLQRSAD